MIILVMAEVFPTSPVGTTARAAVWAGIEPGGAYIRMALLYMFSFNSGVADSTITKSTLKG